MKLHRLMRFPLLGITFLALTLSACGSKDTEEPADVDNENTLSCGPGTVLNGSKCVLTDQSCPEGEVPLPDGGCGEPSTFCAGETVYDSDSDSCIDPEQVVCGEGTIEVERHCIVKDAMDCGSHTVLVNGVCELAESVCGKGSQLEEYQCEPNDDACDNHSTYDVGLQKCVYLGAVECGDGTVEVNDLCIPLTGYVDELAANADIDYSGSSGRTIDLGSADSGRIIFTGALDGTGGLAHTYPLITEEGQWMRISLYPQGAPSIGFQTRTASFGWSRRVYPGISAIASRTILPVSSDSHNLIVDTSLSDSGMGIGVANSTWTYVGVAELIEAPIPRQWDDIDEILTGNFLEPADSYVEIPIEEDEAVLVTLQSVSDDIEDPVVEIWRSPSDYENELNIREGEPLRIEGESGYSSVILRFDAIAVKGPRTDFTLSAQESVTLGSGLSIESEIYAEKGQLVTISQQSEEKKAIAVQAFLDDEQVFSQEEVLAQNKGSFSTTESNKAFFVAPEDGTYTIRFENSNIDDLTDFYPGPAVQDIPVIEIPDDEPAEIEAGLGGQDLKAGDWRFVLLKTGENGAAISGQLSSTGTSQSSIFNLDGEEIGSAASINFNYDIFGEEDILFAARPGTGPVNDLKVKLETKPISTIAPQESLSETFEANTFDILSGTIDYRSGSAPIVRILNPDGVAFVEHDLDDGELELYELLPGSGTFTIEVSNENDEEDAEPSIDVEFDYKITTPLDVFSVSNESTQTISTSGAYDEEDQDLILLHAQGNFKHKIKAVVEEDEEISIRLINFDTGEEIDADIDEEEAQITHASLPFAYYLLEVTAESELSDGYDLDWEILLSSLREATGAPVDIPSATGTGASNRRYDESSVQISDCPTIDSINVEIEKGNSPTTWSDELHFTLITPHSGEFLLVDFKNLSANSSAVTFSYPEIDTPKDSFDDLIGENGTGEWTLKFGYQWSNAPDFGEWRLTLDCSN